MSREAVGRLKPGLRVALALTMVTTTLGLLAAPASACSCVDAPPGMFLEDADGAFIGSLVTRGEAEPNEQGQIDSSQYVPFTFEVSEWIKGDLSPGIYDISSPNSGASCGFEVQPGRKVAVLVNVRGDQVTGGLCSTYSVASLRGHVAPSPIVDVPARFFVPGFGVPDHLLGANGETVAVAPVDGRYGGFHVACGGSLMAENHAGKIVLVDVATFQEVESIPFTRRVRRLICSDAYVLVVGGPKDDIRVYDARRHTPISATVTARSPIALHGSRLTYLAAGDAESPSGWRALDLATGVDTFLAPMERPAGAKFKSIQISPDGTRVATAVAGENYLLEIAVHSLDGSPTVTRGIGTPTGRLWWLDNDRLIAHGESKGRRNTTSQVVRATDLTTIADLGGRVWWAQSLVGEHIIGTKQGTILSAPVDGGEVETLNQLTTERPLVLLPEPVTIVAGAGGEVGIGLTIPIASPRLEQMLTAAVEATPEPAPDEIEQPDAVGPTHRPATSVESPDSPDPAESAGQSVLVDNSADSRHATLWAAGLIAATVVLLGLALLVRRRSK